ncbi:hypothetical protein TNCV_2155621 [Trichonephila clavipes]|nr:hypothetical protein TNCV_2155621 [Trichonephila clavipes]
MFSSSGLGSLVVEVTVSRPTCHESEPGSAEEPPYIAQKWHKGCERRTQKSSRLARTTPELAFELFRLPHCANVRTFEAKHVLRARVDL